MAGYFMQHYFSDKVKEQLPYAGQAAIDLYPNSYKVGALGFDLLKPIEKLTAKLDYKYAYEFFDYASDYIYQSGSKVQLAYMLGLMSHYVLDSRVNPYIYYLQEKGVPKYFGKGKGFLTKEQIQDSLDAHIQKMSGVCLADIKLTGEEAREIQEVYKQTLPAIIKYPFNADKIASILQKFKLPIIAPFEMTEYDYMNRQKGNWLTVRNGGWQSDMSLDELLEKLVPIAVKMCEYLITKIRSASPLDSQLFVLNYQGILSQDTN